MHAHLTAQVAPLAAIGWHVLDRFHIGSRFAVSPHGVGIAVGYLAGAWVLTHEGPKRGVSEEQVSSLVFWGLIGSIVGARVGYVLSHLSEFHSVLDVVAVYRGGISLVGGIVGWIVVSLPVIRRMRIRVLDVFDSAAMPLAVGIVLGRIGDLVIGDHLGKPTSWALAFQYHGGNLSGYDCTTAHGACTISLFGGQSETVTRTGARLYDSSLHVLQHGVGVHQTALYDFLSTMVLVLLLLWLLRKPRRRGIPVLAFGTWYAGMRIVTDFLRVENRFLGLTGSQWASVAVVAFCTLTLLWFALHPKPYAGASRGSPAEGGELPAG